MIRRDFLKLSGALALAPTWFVSLMEDDKKKSDFIGFDPNKSYFGYATVSTVHKNPTAANEPHFLELERMMKEEMESVIPTRYRRHVKWYLNRQPSSNGLDPMSQRRELYWVYNEPASFGNKHVRYYPSV